MKVSVKLPLGFFAGVALVIVLGSVNIYSMGVMSKSINETANNWLPSIRELGGMSRRFLDLRRFQLATLLADSDEGRAQQQKIYWERLEKLRE